MYTLRRYVYRIFIPFAAVGVVAVVVRFVMYRDFAERHVSESEPPQATQAATEEQQTDYNDYSDENKEELSKDLQQSARKVARAFEIRKASLSDDAISEAEAAAKRLEDSIEDLSSATEKNWQSRRSTAYDNLAAYAQAATGNSLDSSRDG